MPPGKITHADFLPEGLTAFTSACKREQADFARFQDAVNVQTKRMKFQPPWMQSPQKQAMPNSPVKMAIGNKDRNDGAARGLFMGFNPIGGFLRQGNPSSTPTKFQDSLEGPFSPTSSPTPAPSVSSVVLRTRPGTKSPPKAKPNINFIPDKDKDRWTNMAQEAKLVARARRKEINQERRQLFVENIKSSVQPLLLKQ
eukprot:CAMPEP_0118925998 /NCGR_PEP_ID=MMETSP1169-20130426/3792_1 /TAXON_ID=36882 /ORGANISM="Pyramimonas obovata, Strain CCMP722" /LENGTH=197 /DNA_ID=CAMNT_0006867451 /DNA_START=257 /DNA_END=850 /DNA_ORIENTATION=-